MILRGKLATGDGEYWWQWSISERHYLASSPCPGASLPASHHRPWPFYEMNSHWHMKFTWSLEARLQNKLIPSICLSQWKPGNAWHCKVAFKNHFPCCICINWSWTWLSRERKQHDLCLLASCWPFQAGSGCFSSCPISAPPSCLATAELSYWFCSVSYVPWASSLSCAIKPHLANISVCWVMSLTSSYNPRGSISWQSTWEGSVAKALLGLVHCARPPEATASSNSSLLPTPVNASSVTIAKLRPSGQNPKKHNES